MDDLKRKGDLTHRICFWLILILFGFTYQPNGNAQNLILNGDCEKLLVAGNIPDWVEHIGSNWRARTANPPPQSGSQYFFPGAGANAELRQDINVSAYSSGIDAGIQQFNFTGYVRAYVQSPSDLSRIIVEYRDASNSTVLDAYDSGNTSFTSGWLLLSNSRTAPVGCRVIRIRLISTRKNGTNNDGYYDNLSLTTSGILPVNLTDFVAKPKENESIALRWETASEQFNDYFDLQHSIDGIDWKTIGTLEGHGTTYETNVYKFLHQNPSSGRNYYRLRQVDYDGKFNLSEAIVTSLSKPEVLTVFPNPTRNVLYIKGDFDKIEIQNSLGVLVSVDNVMSNKVDVSHLAAGVYFISLTNKGKKSVAKFIKE